MITKITQGARSGDLAAYLHGPGRKGEHAHAGREGGEVIGGNLGREGDRDGTAWAQDLREAASTRADIGRPVWHMSLRNGPQDRRLSDAEWADVAHEMGTAMGWADRPYVVVRHADDHVHIAVSRVGHDGSVWDRSNDRYKARSAAVEIEKARGLTRTPVRSSEATKRRQDHQVTQGEYRRGERTGKAPERVRLADRVREARDGAQGQGRAGFEAALTSAGVDYRANIATTGRMNGYSYHLPGHRDDEGKDVWMSASKLDRSLSWSKMRESLETPRPLPDVELSKGRFESAAKYAERVEVARVQEGQRAASERMDQVPGGVAAQEDQTARWWAQREQEQRPTKAVKVRAARAQEGRPPYRPEREEALMTQQQPPERGQRSQAIQESESAAERVTRANAQSRGEVERNSPDPRREERPQMTHQHDPRMDAETRAQHEQLAEWHASVIQQDAAAKNERDATGPQMRAAEEQRREASETRESTEHVDQMRAEAAQGREPAEKGNAPEVVQDHPESAAARVARANEQSQENEREGYER